MSLKIKGYKKILGYLFWGMLGVLLLAFLIKVALFEAVYYDSKEGSERAVAVQTEVKKEEPEEELVEVAPTEEEVVEYTVAPERPRYLTVPKLGIYKARIIAVGVNPSGELGTPNNIFDVGWYDASGLPGQGGTMFIDGHNGGPNIHGVFKDLPVLANGDIIEVERGDGLVFKYSVVENIAKSLEDANSYMATALKSPEPGKESVTLISCTGEWSQQRGTYLSRQFTRAVLVED